MIWKDYLKLSEIASYSKLERASTPPPPPPTSPGGIGLNNFINDKQRILLPLHKQEDCYLLFKNLFHVLDTELAVES